MVKVYFNRNIFDLTEYVETKSINVSLTGDKTLDTASFSIPDIKSNQILGIDMSRALPRFARVLIEQDGVKVDMVLQSDLIKQIANTNRYEHKVELVSLTKTLLDYSTTALTVTQPQGDIGLYYRSVNKYDNPSGILLNNELAEIPYSVRSNSVDTDILDGVELKGEMTYKANLNIKVKNYTNFPASNPSIKLNVKVSCGAFLQEFTITAKPNNTINYYVGALGKPTITDENLSFDIENIGDNEIIVEIEKDGYPIENIIELVESTLSIYATSNETMDFITMDYVVEKILNNEMNEQKFYLDANSKALLSQFYSYEWTLPESYLWLQIVRVADYIKAFPSCYYEDESVDSRMLVKLIPFDDLMIETPPLEFDFNQSETTIDEYASSIEIAASNVYSKDTVITEHTTLRASGVNAQITTDNLIIPTQHRIGNVHYLEYKTPVAITLSSGVIPKGTWIKLENAVYDKRYYDTLPTQSDYTLIGRQQYNQNNVLFYDEGDKNIKGVSNIGGRLLPPSYSLGDYSRAIYEILLSQIARNEDENPPFIDEGEVSLDLEIEIKVVYSPYAKTNAVMFKDDQSGFQYKGRKLLNESMQINNPDIIGSYAQGVANRSGGTKHSYSGIANLSELPNVLSTYDEMVLFGLSFSMLDNVRCSYTLYYIKDYVFISSYESYDKKERIYQISDENVVERVLKKNNLIIFSSEERFGVDSNYKEPMRDFITHLMNYKPPIRFMNWAKIKFEGGVEIIIALKSTHMSFGRTLEWRVQPKDNYSAGLIKYESGGKWYQKDFRYTDLFGRAENVEIDFFDELPINTDLNDMPKFEIEIAPVYSAKYNLRKDARELPVFSIQYSYISSDDFIRVYDAIGKYSRVFNKLGEFDDIGIASLNYIPTRNAKLLDLSRAEPISMSSVSLGDSTFYGFIRIENGNKPIAFYNINTKEILLVDTRDLASRKIYWRGGGVNDKTAFIVENFQTKVGINLTYERGKETHLSFDDLDLKLTDNIEQVATKGIPINLTDAVGLKVAENLLHRKSKDIGLNLSESVENDIYLSHIKGKSITENINQSSKVGYLINHGRSLDIRPTMNESVKIGYVLDYRVGDSAFTTFNENAFTSDLIEHRKSKDIGDDLSNEVISLIETAYFRSKDIGNFFNEIAISNYDMAFQKGLMLTDTINEQSKADIDLLHGRSLDIRPTINEQAKVGYTLDYRVGDSSFTNINDNAFIDIGIEYRKRKDIGFDLGESSIGNYEIEFEKGRSDIHNLNENIKVEDLIQYRKRKDIGFNLSESSKIVFDIYYGINELRFMSFNELAKVGEAIEHHRSINKGASFSEISKVGDTIKHRKSKDLGLNISQSTKVGDTITHTAQKPIPPTTEPLIANITTIQETGGWRVRWRIRNNESRGQALIYSDFLETPTTYRGMISYNNYTSYITSDLISYDVGSTTIYARAIYGAADYSTIASQAVNAPPKIVLSGISESLEIVNNITFTTQKPTPPTATTPSITLNCLNGIVSYIVKNNDSETATLIVSGDATATFTNVGFNETRMGSFSGGSGTKTINVKAQVEGKLDSSLASANYNMASCPISTTATPTVGTPYCEDDGSTKYLKVSIKNNDTSTATIKNYGNIVATINAGATQYVIVADSFSTPYNYTISITAQADGEGQSATVSRSGKIIFCSFI